MTHENQTDQPAPPMTSAWRNVWILIAAQAILGAQMSMVFIVGGLAGLSLAPTPLLATLPISLIVFGSMTTAPWISPLMQRRGRSFGFMVGAFAGMLGALICAYALFIGSFALFLVGSFSSGIYMSAQGFYRFAATDAAPEAFRPKAISYVMAGGLLSALIGPQLVKLTSEAMIVPFLGTYLAAAALNVVGFIIFPALVLPKARAAQNTAQGAVQRSTFELLTSPIIAVAVICGMVSYGLMNLVMTSTPLAVVGCGYSTNMAADIVSAHVLAMFAPSFFTGHLISRFGAPKIIAVGLVCLMAAGICALAGVNVGNFFGALILLGIGWNFGFIGATALLGQGHSEAEKGRVQGLNDAIVFGCVTLASLSSGGLMTSASSAEAGWSAVNLAMVPLLTLAGAALIWLALRPKDLAARL